MLFFIMFVMSMSFTYQQGEIKVCESIGYEHSECYEYTEEFKLKKIEKAKRHLNLE